MSVLSGLRFPLLLGFGIQRDFDELLKALLCLLFAVVILISRHGAPSLNHPGHYLDLAPTFRLVRHLKPQTSVLD